MPNETSEPFWRKQAAALDAFFESARRQGFVTHSDLAELIPDNSDMDVIEDMMNLLGEMGVHVVEDDE